MGSVTWVPSSNHMTIETRRPAYSCPLNRGNVTHPGVAAGPISRVWLTATVYANDGADELTLCTMQPTQHAVVRLKEHGKSCVLRHRHMPRTRWRVQQSHSLEH